MFLHHVSCYTTDALNFANACPMLCMVHYFIFLANVLYYARDSGAKHKESLVRFGGPVITGKRPRLSAGGVTIAGFLERPCRNHGQIILVILLVGRRW